VSSSLESTIDRLDRVLGDLNVALAHHDHSTVASSTREMCQCLLQLQRAISTDQAWMKSVADAHIRLEGVRSRLQINARALEIQIAAVRQVVSVLVNAERASEADTTYSLVRRRVMSP
jgi:hypothetical protein